MRFAIIVVALSACGDVQRITPDATGDANGPDPNDGALSGSRLKLRYSDFGGTHVRSSPFDSQRNEICAPTEWIDGNWFCVPENTGQIVYADAACTQRMGESYVQPGCTRPAPPYFLEYGYVGCSGAPARLFPRGTRIATTQYFYKDGAGCRGPYNSTSDFYAVGAEVTTAALVQTNPSQPTGSGRLGQRWFESSDGYRSPVPFRLHDMQIGGTCNLSYASDGSTTSRCTPERTAYINYFVDGACSQRLGAISDACPAPQIAVQYENCPYATEHYYQLGTQTSPATIFYKDTPTTCLATTPSTTDRYYSVGAELAVPTLDRAPDTTAGRIQPIRLTTQDGLEVRDFRQYDTQLAAECTVVNVNGTLQCMPTGNTSSTYYTDAACTNAIDLVTIYRGNQATCAPPPLPAYAIRYTETATCGYNYDVFRIGAPYVAAYYESYNNVCSLRSNANEIAYRTGAQVPASEIAVGTIVVDP